MIERKALVVESKAGMTSYISSGSPCSEEVAVQRALSARLFVDGSEVLNYTDEWRSDSGGRIPEPQKVHTMIGSQCFGQVLGERSNIGEGEGSTGEGCTGHLDAMVVFGELRRPM